MTSCIHRKGFEVSKNKSDTDDDYELVQVKPRMFHRQIQAYSSTYYLYEGLGLPNEYLDLFHFLNTASENDRLTIRVNGPGGSLLTCTTLLNAMYQSEAEVELVIDGSCDSAYSMLALLYDNVTFSPNTSMMIHSASYGTGFAKMHEVESHVDYSKDYIRKLLREAYEDFMTEEEIELLFIGKDYYFGFDEIVQRLEYRQEQRKLRKEAEEQVSEVVEDTDTDTVEQGTDPDLLLYPEEPKKTRKKSS